MTTHTPDYTEDDLHRVRSPRWLRGTLQGLLGEGTPPDEAVRMTFQLAAALRQLGEGRVPTRNQIVSQLERARTRGLLMREFTGRNYGELAQQYGVSIRTVRRLIDNPRRR